MSDRYTKAAEAIYDACVSYSNERDLVTARVADIIRKEFAEHDAAVTRLVEAARQLLDCHVTAIHACEDELEAALAALAALEGR